MIRRLALAALVSALALTPADASVLGSRGAASARGFGFGGSSGMKLIAGNGNNFIATSGNIPIPTGANAGDLLLVATQTTNPGVAVTTTATASGSGVLMTVVDCRTWQRAFTTSAVIDASCLFSKVLTASDVSNGNIAISNGAVANNVSWSDALFRGPATTVTFKSFQTHSDGGQNFLTFAGFAPAVNTKGVGQMSQQCNTPSTNLSATGWTQDFKGGSINTHFYLDQFVGYTNASVTFTGYDTTLHCGSAGWLYEFT